MEISFCKPGIYQLYKLQNIAVNSNWFTVYAFQGMLVSSKLKHWMTPSAYCRLWAACNSTVWADHSSSGSAHCSHGTTVPREPSAHQMSPLSSGDCHGHFVRDWDIRLDHLLGVVLCWVRISSYSKQMVIAKRWCGENRDFVVNRDML